MDKNFLGAGWKYPIRVDIDGKIVMSQYEEDIQESIQIILGTSKGERVMRPDFGCGIDDMAFAPINTATVTSVKSAVTEALTRWEPRIELINVDESDERSYEGILLISIDYRVRVTNNQFNIVHPFYLTEGS